jgi:hypothetical protein
MYHPAENLAVHELIVKYNGRVRFWPYIPPPPPKKAKEVSKNSIKMTVFFDVAPCSLVDTDQCYRGAYCLHIRVINPNLSTSSHDWPSGAFS